MRAGGRPGHRLGRRLAGAAMALALLAGAAACSGGDDGSGSDRTTSAPPSAPRADAPDLPALHAVRGEHAGIYDAEGRQVLLRGVNVNSLAEYAQANPKYPTTVPVTGTDWDRMAAEGFSAVRLLISWSRLEPAPGRVDRRYLQRIRSTVRAAARRGIYSVLDMHQDAWGPSVATPQGTTCPEGKEPAIGWDGAPRWATPKAGPNSCRGGSREDSELVHDAWDRFYADADGIQSHLVDVWGQVAEALAAEPGVGGYDLLNEPNPGRDLDTSLDRLGEYYAKAIAAIRAGERNASVEGKPIFFEYTVYGQSVPTDFSDDPGLVFAPHIYGGSIAALTVDQNWDYALSVAKGYRTTLWVGEYGWFEDDNPEFPERIRTFGEREDAALASGGAWWQWRQACGDPHSVNEPGGTPAEVIVEYQDNGCPGDRNLGVVPQFHEVVSRPYPRAAPGRITRLRSDGEARSLDLAGEGAEPGTELDVWAPGAKVPQVASSGLRHVRKTEVPGGWRVTAQASAATYLLSIDHS